MSFWQECPHGFSQRVEPLVFWVRLMCGYQLLSMLQCLINILDRLMGRHQLLSVLQYWSNTWQLFIWFFTFVVLFNPLYVLIGVFISPQPIGHFHVIFPIPDSESVDFCSLCLQGKFFFLQPWRLSVIYICTQVISQWFCVFNRLFYILLVFKLCIPL